MADGKVMIKVLYEDNHLLIVEKPINVLVQADDSKDKDLLTILKEDLKKRYNKPGNVYLGLVHRLDRPVGGIMVFAKTSKAASRLSEQIRSHQFKKVYHAIVMNDFNEKKGTMQDKLLKNEKTNTVTVDPNGKESVLEYEVVSFKDNLSLVKINLKTGRSHQIRVQFSSRNHALYGDQRYNKHASVGQQIALFASEISFLHPVTKENINIKIDFPNRFPWNLFRNTN